VAVRSKNLCLQPLDCWPAAVAKKNGTSFVATASELGFGIMLLERSKKTKRDWNSATNLVAQISQALCSCTANIDRKMEKKSVIKRSGSRHQQTVTVCFIQGVPETLTKPDSMYIYVYEMYPTAGVQKLS
jgi:hypothetical protein